MSCIECTSSCIECVGRKFRCLEVWWLGGIYSPNHQNGRWGRLLSYGTPDSPVHHRTLSGAPATSPGHWVPTVGALTSGATGQYGGAPDSHCSLYGAPSGAALTLRALFAHCSRTVHFCRRPLALIAVAPHGTPDSPVNYSGVALQKPEAEQFRVDLSGAPDSPVCQTRATFGWFCYFLFEPYLGPFYWFVLNLWHL